MIEKIGKLILVLGILGFMIYMSSDKISAHHEELARRDHPDSIWEDSNLHRHWFINLVQKILSENFSWFAIKEMSFYIGLTIASLTLFGILSYYNNKYDEQLLKEQAEILARLAEKKKKEESKSKFAKKKNN